MSQRKASNDLHSNVRQASGEKEREELLRRLNASPLEPAQAEDNYVSPGLEAVAKHRARLNSGR